MAARCPGARALGVAALPGWRFVITADGYASIVRAPGCEVVGVLWRLTLRDFAPLNSFESIDSGLYRRHMIAVRHGGAVRPALVYLGRARAAGRPRPGYVEFVAEAAREWNMPPGYIRSLERWLPSGLCAARAAEIGELR